MKNYMKNYMKLALKEAAVAASEDEVPVGAVVVKDDEVISIGHNMTRQTHDPTAHAEIVAIRKAAVKLGSSRLVGCKIYVTLEPCSMCIGALVQARISELIIGADDPKSGACGTAINLVNSNAFNHKIDVFRDDSLPECGDILKKFFKAKRWKRRNIE